jgi:hypothetical protein
MKNSEGLEGPTEPEQMNNSKEEFNGLSGKGEQYTKLSTIKEALRQSSKAPESACYSAAQFIIGNALHNCKFTNDMGDVNSNLSFLFIAPSSTFKSPLMRALHKIYLGEFKEQGIFLKSKFTTEGLMNFLDQYRRKFENEDNQLCPVFKCIVLRDEASNLAKESKAGRASNIWEFLSEAYDGTIFPYDTVRGKDQTYPDIWMSFWFSSTLTIYQYLNDDFWDQGFAYRCLFIKPEASRYTGMNNPDARIANEKILNEIIELNSIQYAEASEEWKKKYDEYVAPIINAGAEEIETLQTGENVPIENRAMKKYPEITIKLSMIHCASRRGFKEENGTKYLFMEKQDLQKAIDDLNIYKENFLLAYRSYQLKKREPTKMEKLDEERKIVFRIFENLPKSERMNITTEKMGDDIVNRASKNEAGEYISVSNIYAKTRWNKKTVKAVLETMQEADEVEIIEAYTSNKTYKKSKLIRDIRGENIYAPDEIRVPRVDVSKLPPDLRKKLGR